MLARRYESGRAEVAISGLCRGFGTLLVHGLRLNVCKMLLGIALGDFGIGNGGKWGIRSSRARLVS